MIYKIIEYLWHDKIEEIYIIYLYKIKQKTIVRYSTCI